MLKIQHIPFLLPDRQSPYPMYQTSRNKNSLVGIVRVFGENNPDKTIYKFEKRKTYKNSASATLFREWSNIKIYPQCKRENSCLFDLNSFIYVIL